MANVETIDDTLHSVRVVRRCSRQCENPEMGILRGHEPDNLVIGVVSRGMMSLVCEIHEGSLVVEDGKDLPTTKRMTSSGLHRPVFRSDSSV
jgi:hypothetical protein